MDQVAFFAHPLKDQRFRIAIRRHCSNDGQPYIAGEFRPLAALHRTFDQASLSADSVEATDVPALVTDETVDISPERQDSSPLGKSDPLANNLLRAVLEALPTPTLIKDENFRYLFGNNAFCTLVGYDADELIGKDDFELFGGPAESIRQSDRRVMQTGKPSSIEFEINAPEGGTLAFTGHKSRCRTPDGRTFLVGSTMDITRLREREQELMLAREAGENANAILAGAADAMAQGLFVIAAGKTQLVNQKFLDLLNVPPELMMSGRSWRDFLDHCVERGDFQGAVGEETVRQIVASVEEGSSYTLERQTADGQWLRIDAQPAGNDTMILTYTDITDHMERQRELNRLLEKAEAADRAKSEFLATMSHEIRTPMNGVIGMAELLSRTPLDQRQKTFTNVIVKSGATLLAIINDILDFSRIEAGQLVLENQSFDLREAIEDVAAMTAARAAEKDVELIVSIHPGLDCLVVGDQGRLHQILTNLVGNAVKFTEVGHVVIEMTGERTGDHLAVRLAVRDTGIGIPKSKLATIFEKFSQVDGTSTRRHEGTGLGLAITSRLVAMMGGSIEVESSPGEGSTFTICLDLPVDPAQPLPKPLPVDVKGARILVIDDNAVNRQILSEQLYAWGFDACAASSGDEGARVIDAAAQRGITVDAVIVDYHMPQLNGADVVRGIRQFDGADDLPVIMLTSMDPKTVEPDFARLSIQATLMKPARSSLLRETVVNVLQNSVRFRAGAPLRQISKSENDHARPESVEPAAMPEGDEMAQMRATEPATPRPGDPQFANASRQNGALTILVAEDNEVNQIVFSRILEEMNIPFRIVANGREAIACWREDNPQMILMDVSMPVMNGHEATAAIREIEAENNVARRTPIIGVTAHALDGDRERCIAAGMDDYLPKPISPEKLEEKIAEWLPSGTLHETAHGNGTAG
nr:response regulator [Pseudohoeflea sp. DP4N28-3]